MRRFLNKIKAGTRRCLKIAGSPWFKIAAWVIFVLTVTAWFSNAHWCWLSDGESGSTTVRNVGLAVAAAIGLPIAIWRSVVAELQAKTAQRSLLNERYQKGAEMLGSEVLSVRLGGIYALARLAREHPGDYHLQILSLLCAFVRNPTLTTTSATQLREDVQEVMTALGSRSGDQVKEEGESWMNLTHAELRGVHLIGANFDHASLIDAKLNDACLDFSQLNHCLLQDANLSHATMMQTHLNNADLNGAILINAKMLGAKLNQASLSGTKLTNAKLKGAHMNDASLASAIMERANLKGATLMNADLTEANLKDANLSGAILKDCIGLTQEQLDETFEASPDPPKQLDVLDANTYEPLVWKAIVTT